MDAPGNEADRQITGIAALSEPVRRALYLYVARQDHDVTRDEAAGALDISRGLAAFHLDKLVEEGLLQTQYRRLTGRTGPGAGRPSKLYRRSQRELQLSLPPRSYDLAASLLAQAIEDSRSEGVHGALRRTAHHTGAELGAAARGLAGPGAGPAELLQAVELLLTAHGYEPYRADDNIRLRNCPFHALAAEHRDLVCGMNHALMQGVLDGLALPGVEAVLDPQPGRCCVAFRAGAAH